MGLFDKKTPCAICGGKVSPLFPWKIDGQMVCNECYGDVDLPNDIMERMTIQEFKKYMAFRKENALLKRRFLITRQVDFGWLDDKFLFDMNHGLLCMDKKLKTTVFEGQQIKSFEIKEDMLPLFSGSAEGLSCYISTVPERVMAMAPQVEQFKIQLQMKREVEYMLEHREDDGDGRGYYSMPTVNIPAPFQNFHVEIRFEHPYWPLFTACKAAPIFDSTTPDINDYLKDYNRDVLLMEELARTLMELAFPDAPERTVASYGFAQNDGNRETASDTVVDAVEQIQRFKDLMDKGIITEDEFTAKKRQLLGI